MSKTKDYIEELRRQAEAELDYLYESYQQRLEAEGDYKAADMGEAPMRFNK